MKAAILCAARNSIYHRIADVDVYDIDRDARLFDLSLPIVGHPPCRAWSAFCAHQAKPAPGEKELGLWICEVLRQCGGVLEQPAHSRLFAAAGIPTPGEPQSEGVWSIQVDQWWFGHPAKKATWLAFAHVDPKHTLPPLRLHNGQSDREAWNRLSKNRRAETCREMANWLIDIAASVYRQRRQR